MSTETPVNPESHLWKSWLDYKETQEFTNSLNWAGNPAYRVGSMWAAYEQGYREAEEACHPNDKTVLMYSFVAAIAFGVGIVCGALW